jgi:hypothetical protein
MRARDTGEEHRASTPLEAFFDLCLVVAVAIAGQHLHLRRHHADHGHPWLFPAAVLLVLGSAFTPVPVLLAGVCLLLLVIAGLLTARVEAA